MTVQNNKTKKLIIIALICIIFVSALLIGFMLFNKNDNTQEPLLDNELTQEITNQEDGEDIIIEDINQEDLPEDIDKEEYYSVIFLDSNGDTLESKLFKKGSTPYYSGKSLSSKSRKFNTWIPSISTVNGNQAYIATYFYPESSTSSNNNSSSGGGSTPSSSNTYASIIYNDIEGNQQSLILESGTTINFSAGEHGTYDSVPSSITLTDNQQLDITSSTYNPSKAEVNYIFKGFSYSGNTMKCEYSLSSNTVNVECKQVAKPIDNAGTQYLQLDYIESTGIQFINTNIEISENTLKQNLSIETECAFTDTTISSVNQATGKNQGNYFFFGVNTSGVFYSGIGRDYKDSSKSYDTNFHKHKLEAISGKGKYYVDGVVIYDYATLPYAASEYVGYFHLGNVWTPVGGNNYIVKCKFRRCTCYYKNVLSKDLIPVERLDGAIGMYDLVSGNFLTNAGSGEFNHPDVKSIPAANIGKIYAIETGSGLKLTAVANSGYRFVKWADNNSTDATRTVNIGDGAAYTALFAIDG